MSDGVPVNPTTTVKPTLKTIFRYGYLAAFNAHDADTLMSYVSPNIKVSRFFNLLSPHTNSLRRTCTTHCTLVFVTQGGPTRRTGVKFKPDLASPCYCAVPIWHPGCRVYIEWTNVLSLLDVSLSFSSMRLPYYCFAEHTSLLNTMGSVTCG